MNQINVVYAVYIAEHPDHTCTLHVPSPDEEQAEAAWMKNDCLWSERLGTIAHSHSAESGNPPGFPERSLLALVGRCSRPMILLSDWESHIFLARDYGQALLDNVRSKYIALGATGGPGVPGVFCAS